MTIPDRMAAVCLTGFGGPEKLEYREDVPVPRPQKEEVLLRVGACAVNNTDLWTRRGAYGGAVEEDGSTSGWRGGLQFPLIQGSDIVGEIVAVGDGVPSSRVGQRVVVNPTLYSGDGEDGLFGAGMIGSERDGGFAEYATVPEDNAIPVSSSLSDAELATFMLTHLTAEHMLNRGTAQSGDRVLITGTSGGVGSALLQLAKRRGAETICVVGEGKEDRARSLGADATITRGADPVEALHDLGYEDVDLVVDVVGGDQAVRLLDALVAGGELVIAGAIAGPTAQIDWRKVYLRHLSILGSTLGTKREGRDIVRYIESSEIRPLLSQVFPLAELKRAQETFKEKKFFGKLVVVPTS